MIEKYGKTYSPLVRKHVQINNERRYLVTATLEQGFKWIFDEEICNITEKIDGSNHSVEIVDNQIKGIYTRNLNEINVNNPNKGEMRVLSGVARAKDLELFDLTEDKVIYGELIGLGIQGNPYNLDYNIFVPFEYLRENYAYKTYPKSVWDLWIYMRSLKPLYMKECSYFEGIIFYNTKTKQRAKLRFDMFADFYTEKFQSLQSKRHLFIANPQEETIDEFVSMESYQTMFENEQNEM